MTVSLDISEARRTLSRMAERLREDRVIWITRHDKKAFAIVDAELMEVVEEVMQILANPKGEAMLQESLDDIKAGRLLDHEDVKRELL